MKLPDFKKTTPDGMPVINVILLAGKKTVRSWSMLKSIIYASSRGGHFCPLFVVIRNIVKLPLEN
jgi:hypothetical protein